MKRMAIAGLLASVSALGLAACSNEPAAKLVGAQVDNYMLVDQTGIGHFLKYDTHTPAVVLVSHVNGDEGARAAAKAAEALAEKHPDVVFQLINSSEADTRETIAAEAAAQGITLPILDDEFQLIGESLGVTYAGEAVVVDPKTWQVVFHGPAVDKNNSLEAALDEIKAGSPVTVAHVAGKGAPLEFASRGKEAEFANISYVNDIAPILMDRCVDCHQPGGIAPWQMTSYEVVKGFGPMIREAVRTDRMPPYDVDRHYNQYINDENLTEHEIKTLIHWIEAGSPRGEGDDPLQKGVTSRPEWPLGEPDLVVEIPPYDIPAAGIVDYQTPVVASPLKEGKWLAATTFKAGDRQTVHHILAGWLPKMPPDGRGFDWNVSLGGYAVGSESNLAPDNWATWIPPGGALSFQMHYTPMGRAVTDRSRIGLYFKDEPPEFMKRQIIIADPTIVIEPNEPRWHERGYVQFPADVQIFAAQVHAHYRGYASKLTAVYPDGREEIILNMPHYDFNWQREYIFKELIDLPAGSKLVADYWYDNSVNNKALAADSALTDPTKTVEWGDQSFEEMLFTGVQFRWKDETATNRRDDLQQQLEESSFFTVADDNLDGKLQLAELRSQNLEGLKPHFDQFDVDKDGGLSGQEFGAAMQAMQEQARAQRAQRAREQQ